MKTLEELLNNQDREPIPCYIDMVMVIDATEDSPFVNNDKFWRKLITQTIRTINDPENILNSKRIPKIRIKILYFRDFYFDGKYAFGESDFFNVPEDLFKTLEYINNIQAAGCGDIPESGLEALWMALNADYHNSFSHRCIITLFTNAPAHPLEEYHTLVKDAQRNNCSCKLSRKTAV